MLLVTKSILYLLYLSTAIPAKVTKRKVGIWVANPEILSHSDEPVNHPWDSSPLDQCTYN